MTLIYNKFILQNKKNNIQKKIVTFGSPLVKVWHQQFYILFIPSFFAFLTHLYRCHIICQFYISTYRKQDILQNTICVFIWLWHNSKMRDWLIILQYNSNMKAWFSYIKRVLRTLSDWLQNEVVNSHLLVAMI